MARTVLVTGASSGIGKEFAEQLASQGNHLVITGRNEKALMALADDLRSRHRIQCDVLLADLTLPNASEALTKQIAERQLTIDALINNAGFGDRGTFDALGFERQTQMIQVNVNALVELTHLLLPQIKRSGKGYIINVASTAAFQAGPHMAVYYATKAFVLSFTEALHEEMKGQGVHVSCLCPGPTNTGFIKEANMDGSLLFKAGAMHVEPVVKKALRGVERNQSIVIPGLLNQVTAFFSHLVSRALSRKISSALQK